MRTLPCIHTTRAAGAHLLYSLALLLAILPLLMPASAGAHDMPKSSVMLHFRQNHLLLDVRLPQEKLEQASGLTLATPDNSGKLAKADQAALQAYLLARLHAFAEDGQAWAVQLQALNRPNPGKADNANNTEPPNKASQAGQPDQVQALFTLTPPPNGALTRFRLDYDIILREIATHIAVLSVQSDWDRGVLASQPELLATLRFDEHSIKVQRSAPGTWAGWRGFAGMFQLGVEHIAAGVDHILFLLTLLLTAPVLAKAGRWQRQGAWRAAIWQVFTRVSAFTLGHSLALALAATGLLLLPSQPVEVLIAASVLVSALHAARPLYAGREAFVAAGFGLVHGLAFAASLSAFALDPAHLASALLGFNLGIEAVQLLVVLATVPALMLLGATPWFGHFRLTLAALAGVTALGWILERSTGWQSPLTPLTEQLPAHALALAAGLLALALLAWFKTGYKNRHPAACISNERC